MRGKITKQELNENLIEDIVFQEELQEAIENVDVDLSNYPTKEDLQEAIENVDVSDKQDKTDDSLLTNDKSLVGAINELFQNANNGKQLIADAIGNELITGNSTFKAMSEAILNLRSSSDNETDVKEVLYNMMIEDGYNEATSEMTTDELIALLDDSMIDQTQTYVEKIYSGDESSYVLKSDGTLWACGKNTYGELGLGHTTTKNSFTQVKTNVSNVKEISCGYNHVFMIKNDGTVWACGLNDKGQLGLGDTTNRNTFTQVPNMNNVKEIKCGAKHTILLKNDGTVWGCGRNTFCELGLYNVTTGESTTFISLYNGKSDAQSIAANKDFSFILSNTGKLYGSGNNFAGQLGTAETGMSSFTQVQTNVKTVIPGDSFTYIIKNDNTVWSTGRNTYGQLGLGNTTDKDTFTKVTNIDNVKEICCGNSFSVILKNDGTVWSCGANYNAQLGLGYASEDGVTTFTKLTTNNTNTKDIDVYGSHGLMLKNDNNVYSWGFQGLGTSAVTHTKPTEISSIAPKDKYSTYEINRLKLYYYLLDNEIPVTESMDIGTMLDLLVDDYVNNMLNGYYNNLKLVLIDEGVEVTEEDDMNSLIVKVDEEFDRKNSEIADVYNPYVLYCVGDSNESSKFTTGDNAYITNTSTAGYFCLKTSTRSDCVYTCTTEAIDFSKYKKIFFISYTRPSSSGDCTLNFRISDSALGYGTSDIYNTLIASTKLPKGVYYVSNTMDISNINTTGYLTLDYQSESANGPYMYIYYLVLQ